MVDNYRIQDAYFVDTKNPEYKGPWNQIVNIPRATRWSRSLRFSVSPPQPPRRRLISSSP
jgi:hypothetical protein